MKNNPRTVSLSDLVSSPSRPKEGPVVSQERHPPERRVESSGGGKPGTALTAAPSHAVARAQARPGEGRNYGLEKMREILLKLGVKSSHVHIALRRHEETGESLPQIMRDFGFLSGEGVAEAVSLQTGHPYFTIDNAEAIDGSSLDSLNFSEFSNYVPVAFDGRTVRVAVPDASAINAATNAYYNLAVEIVIASEHTIQTIYRKHFAKTERAFKNAVAAFMSSLDRKLGKDEDEKSVGLVRDIYFALLRHACYAGASDLYLSRSEYVGIIRLKVSGVGQIFQTISIPLYDRLLNKLVQDNTKADDLRARPREAAIEFTDEDKGRYQDLATRFGFRLELTESRGRRSAVIRILDKSSSATNLNKLGFDSDTLKAVQRISKTATGFFLVTGPTGSGKTTSLYAILKNIDPVERSVQSIERPIEYEHGLWMQFEPNKAALDEGDELGEWLKALLRNAPDVILIGEVRDRAVANVCLNAANTGHLVFATLHTNDATMAVARLKSLDIDLDVLGSVLLGILAQRLLRVLCPKCKEPDNSSDVTEYMGAAYLGTLKKTPFKCGPGCAYCDYTGYKSRRMIYELLQVTPKVREAIEKGHAPSVVAKHGMPEERTMWAEGLRLVSAGITSLDELMRVATRHS